ncbi:SDR family oxidoreductase [Oryzomonas sagensis]|uniref:SDR family oxidoreductase n=1 Tax=Oryzomonas sagensis TaxID=2603857 RepID=A0ABQ6TKC7_9BACT|nr:SDR family oxidoreductase [Oryzomonas sagensis]KAB0668526.1 SDR family oxidoreductase [Oryzomonas sagensis]
MNDTVLITGVSSGVGLSLTEYLSRKYHVLAVARQGQAIQDAFRHNRNVTTYCIDLAKPEELESGLGHILENHPYIPYVINNAGVNRGGTFDSLDMDDVMRSFRVNCFAPLYILKKTIPAMKAHNFGRVINVTSGAPLNCFPGYGAYSSSKGALNAFTVTAAKECNDYNIKINLMSPGPVRSNMAPDAPMPPSVCHPTVDYLLSLDENGPSGRFFWLGYEIPLFPELEGISWLEGKADERYRRVL